MKLTQRRINVKLHMFRFIVFFWLFRVLCI